MKNETQSQLALSIDQRQRHALINELFLLRNNAIKKRRNELHPNYEAQHQAKLKAYNETYY